MPSFRGVEALVFVLLVLGNSLCQSAQPLLLGRFFYIVIRVKNLITFKSHLWGIMFCKEVLHCKDTVPKIGKNMYSQKGNCAASVLISTFIYLWAIFKIGLPIWLQQNRWTDPGNIWIAHRCMNMEFGNKAAQFDFWEYIIWIKILDLTRISFLWFKSAGHISVCSSTNINLILAY